MVDFRKALLLLALLVFVSGIASAQALNCTLNGGAPPLLRAEGIAEEVGQAFITCVGGTPTPTGQPLPRINVRLFTNGYNITSRLFDLGGGVIASEATLLIDDPAPAAQVLASFPTPPLAPGCVAPYNPTNCGNVFRAFQVSGNSQAVEWRNIPFDPPVTPGQARVLRFVNIRVNAALATGGNVTSLIPPPVNIFVSVTGTFTLPLSSPFLAVGYIQNGLQFTLRNRPNDATITSIRLPQCAKANDSPLRDNPEFFARFIELFPTAFRPRFTFDGAYNAIPQNDLTQIYNSESMFWGPPAYPLGTGYGQATQGTRLRLAFANLPAGVRLFVPSVVSGTGWLVQLVPLGVDGNTTDPSAGTPGGLGLPGGYREISLTGGNGAAIYEVWVANSGASETVQIPVHVRYSGLPALGDGTVSGSYAPLSTVQTASTSAPAPRFLDGTPVSRPFSVVPCETRLLFPFVTSIAGWDTGIAISNTTADPFGTAAQSGTCSLHFYGTSNTTQTSSTIAAGSQLVFAMSQGNAAQNISALTDFTGYLIARCNFQYAHGYAFISDLGVNKYAQGYIALVIGGGLEDRYSVNAAESLGN